MSAALRSLGMDSEHLDIVQGCDVVACNLRSPMPQICSIQDFFPGLFPKKEKEKTKKEKEKEEPARRLDSGISFSSRRGKVIEGMRSAEQLMALQKFLQNRGKKSYA